LINNKSQKQQHAGFIDVYLHYVEIIVAIGEFFTRHNMKLICNSQVKTKTECYVFTNKNYANFTGEDMYFHQDEILHLYL
jgi:hypothetical protein